MIRNLAILAHVDAGKTTLSERILFMAREILHPGNVDEGLATLDYLPEEKAKGITIEAGIETFHWKNQQFNILDTPGHIDFGVEVDLALETVEGAVLVISGTGGVETQTVTAWKKLRERGVPTILFINKLDHPDHRLDDVLLEVEERLDIRPLVLSMPESRKIAKGMLDVITNSRVRHDVDGRESIVDTLPHVHAEITALRKEAIEAAASVDDDMLELALNGADVTPQRLADALQKLFRAGVYAPCYVGSAICCRGVRQLMTGIGMFMPAPQEVRDAKLFGTIVRIRHDRQGNEYALFKSARELAKDRWPANFSFSKIHAEMLAPLDHLNAHDIVAAHLGDLKPTLGMHLDLKGNAHGEAASIARFRREVYHPLLHTRLECQHEEDWARIDQGLQLLVRCDPSIQVQRDSEAGGWILKTVGEVQLEVQLSRLQREMGCRINAGKPQVIQFENLKHAVGPQSNTYQPQEGSRITLEIRLQPEAGQGISRCEFKLASGTSIVESTQEAIQDALLECLQEGVAGAGDIRGACIQILQWEAPQPCPIHWVRKVCQDLFSMLVRPECIEIFEPYMDMEVETAPDYAGNLIGDLQARGGKVREIGGDGKIVKIFLDIPLQRVFGYSTIGRSISKGTASYALRYSGHRSLQA